MKKLKWFIQCWSIIVERLWDNVITFCPSINAIATAAEAHHINNLKEQITKKWEHQLFIL